MEHRQRTPSLPAREVPTLWAWLRSLPARQRLAALSRAADIYMASMEAR
ncbi:hypothetical protein [Streptomyces sp. URMC 129]